MSIQLWELWGLRRCQEDGEAEQYIFNIVPVFVGVLKRNRNDRMNTDYKRGFKASGIIQML